jgi:hypothetical protein
VKPFFFALVAAATGGAIYAATWLMAIAGWFIMPSAAFVLSVIVTAAVYSILFRTKEPMLFTNLYLLTIALKVLLFGVFLFLIKLLWAATDLTANAVLLMMLYVVLTALEVTALFLKVNR